MKPDVEKETEGQNLQKPNLENMKEKGQGNKISKENLSNENIFKFSAVSQEGEKYSSSAKLTNKGCGSSKFENKANPKPSLNKSTHTKRIIKRKKKLNELQPPIWRYTKLSDIFKPKIAAQLEQRPNLLIHDAPPEVREICIK